MAKPNLKKAKIRRKEEVKKSLHPLVKEWFFNKFEDFSLPQLYGVLPIYERKNILVSAPTGGTKCLTPDETILVNEKGSAKLVEGKDLIKKGKKGKLVKNIDKTGKLNSVQGLKSYSLKNNKISKTNALVYYEDIKDELLNIKTEYGREVKISKNHPLLVEKKGWTKAKNLEVGDKIAAPKRIKLPEKEISLKWRKALENIKEKARFCITYKDYLKLKEKIKNFGVLNSEEIKKTLTLLRLSYKDIGKDLGISITAVYRIIHKKTNFKRKEFEEYLQKKLRDINFEKNRIIYKTYGAHEFSFKYSKKLNFELAGWIAFLLAEGLIGDYKSGASILVSQKNKKKLLKKFLKDSEKYFDIKFKKNNEKDYHLYSTLFAEFIVDLFSIQKGRGRNVRFPNWILNCKRKEKKTFLYTFFSLESSLTYREIKLSQANKQKIEIINYLLMSFGIFCSIRKFKAYASNTKNRKKRKYYQISIGQIRNLNKFIHDIGIDHKEKKRMKKHLKNKTSGSYVNKHVFDFKKIRKLAKYYSNDLELKKELKNIYKVVRRTGYITEEALKKLYLKAEKDFPEDPILKDIEKMFEKDIFWLKIKKINKFDYEGRVFDLTVPDVQNFVGGFGGVILHNTLTAFLSILNYLVRLADKKELEDKIYAVYTSPLKALSSDIHVNLVEPLKEINELAKKKGKKLQNIRVGLRTGDTPTKERSKQLRKPPHILVTTPETLAIVLNAKKFKLLFEAVEYVLVDEIHALANKRGVHLSLSLERLEEMSVITPVRIGLSATVAPLKEIAKFLTGNRNCLIADVKLEKKIQVKILTPTKSLIETTGKEMHDSLYSLIDKLIQKHKTTLIFTNTRAATERVVHHLKEKFPKNYTENIGAHHSSLSKQHRFNIEDRLRKGKLKVVVCLDGDTKILDSEGKWIKIKEIEKKSVQSVNKELKINNNKVKNIFKTKNNEKLLKLKTEFEKEITCTKNHKFLTINKNGNLTWKTANELNEKEFIATIRSYNSKKLEGEGLNKYVFENYPDEYFLFLNKEFLKSIKSEITKKFGALKKFWHTSLKEDFSYSYFTHLLLGEYGMKVKILKKLINLLGIKELTAFDAVYAVSSGKYKMFKPHINKDMMRLIGFMLAEGYITKWDLFVSNRDKSLITYYKTLIKKLSGKEPWTKLGSTGTPILGWSSLFLCSFLKNLRFKHGRKARIANIPRFIFRLDSELVFSFLSGYLDGEGYLEVKKDKRVYAAGFSTTSKEMAEDISRLLLREGILSSIRSRYYDEIQKLKSGREIVKKGWFYNVVVLGGGNLRKFAEKIKPVRQNLKRIKKVLTLKGYTNKDVVPNIGKNLKALRSRINISTYKLQKLGLNPIKYEYNIRSISRKQLARLLSLYKSKDNLLLNLSDSDLLWEKIKSKEEVDGKKFVYNIEVENDHNYVANGFLTKNCSTSLELGIDIGYIDLVVLLGSPKSTARAIQRIGRAGHKLHDIAKGSFVVLDRDDLVECAVMKKELVEKKIDRVQIPKNCLDVLSQQIYGMAIHKVWDIGEMLSLIKNSYCYSDLKYEDFLSVISYLSGGYALEDQHVYAKIWYDEEEKKIGKRGRLARVIYMTNIGTIPDESFASVMLARGSEKGEKVGVIDEGFLEKLKKGDVFVLGGSKYEFLYSKGMKVYVKPVVKRPPTIPSWFSEMLPLSFDLANEIGRFRRLIEEKMNEKREEVVQFIKKFCYIEDKIAEMVYDYMSLQYRYKGLPSDKKIVIENYKSDKDYWVFHTLYGRRVNDALSRAMAYLIGQQKTRDIEVGISDNGFYLAGEGIDKNKVKKALGFLKVENIEEILKQTIKKTELLKRRFRHCAGRSLMILRQYKGRKKSAGKQQVKSHFLLAAIRKISKEFPILKEAKREILEDAMDVQNSKKIIKGLNNKEIKTKYVETRIPSPFALGLIIQGRSDLIKMENKIEFLKRMHKEIKKQVK